MPTTQQLAKALNILRVHDPDMPMSVMVTLLALAETDEVEVRDLQHKVDLTPTTLNRALTYLGDRHWSKNSKKDGLGLVAVSIHPEDRRVRVARLTLKGSTLLKSLEGV